MIALLQRVTHARVEVGAERVGAIDHGLLALVGVERDDRESAAERLCDRILGYRVFADRDGKMNLGLGDTGGGLLLVPQFTLAADTTKGMRPSFSSAAPPPEGQRLFEYLLARARSLHAPVASGRFGAHMAVTLTNDGPVTIRLRVTPGK